MKKTTRHRGRVRRNRRHRDAQRSRYLESRPTLSEALRNHPDWADWAAVLMAFADAHPE